MLQTLFRRGGALRDLMVYQIKAPLVSLLNLIADRLPEPTKENTIQPNSHILIKIRDEFFSRLLIKHRIKPLRAIFNLFIIVYEFDEPYRQLIDWVVSRLFASRAGWLPIERNKPDIKIWKQDWQLEEEATDETNRVD